MEEGVCNKMKKEGDLMSKERLFHVKKNDSWHSYEFLEQRQNDPKWRQAFIEAYVLLEQEDKKRKRRNFIILVISVPLVLIVGMVGLYFYGSTDEAVVPKRQLSLNDSTSASTIATEASQTVDTSSVGQVLTTPWGEQVTVLRVLPNGERVIKESPSPSDLNNDGVLTFEELSRVEEEANQQQFQPQGAQNNQQQQQQQKVVPQQEQNNQQQTPAEEQHRDQTNQPNGQPAPSEQGTPQTNNHSPQQP